MAPEIFTLFPLLPSEIRVYIWELATTVPNTLELSCSTPPTICSLPTWWSHTPAPALFHTTSESRAVALSVFTLLEFGGTQIGVSWPRKLYMNFEYDTLSLDNDLHSRYARSLLVDNEMIKEKLKRIVLRQRLWEQLNEVALTPGPAIDPRWDSIGYALESFPVAVAGGLKALVDVKFHGK